MKMKMLPFPSAREIAFQALQDWEVRGLEAHQSLERQFNELDLSEVERALSMELAFGVIRRRLTLDEGIRQCSGLSLSRIPKALRNILRLGLYQLLYMDRVPVHAAVDESVKLAKKFCHGSSPGFANAVLREFLRRGKTIAFPVNDPVKALSFSTSHPLELVERWVKLWGLERAKELCEVDNERPPWVLRVNRLKTTRSQLLEKLKEEGIGAEKGDPPLAIRLKKSYPLSRLKSFQEGLFQVQDESMLRVIDELALEPGLRVLDLCSAPGTKATAMAESMNDRGMILAIDHSFPRMRMMTENIRRLGLSSIRTVVADARSVSSLARVPFDRVLVDVPCSNTGVLNRRVEARWRFSHAHLKRLSDLQAEILKSALSVLKSGGLLVYSTCSIDPIENEEVIRRVLKEKPCARLLGGKTFFQTKTQGGGYWSALTYSFKAG